MNHSTHPDTRVGRGAKTSTLEVQNPVCTPWWMLLLPALPVIPSIVMAELGLSWISANSALDPAVFWMMQTLITGYIAILLLTAWENALCRLRWPDGSISRQNLAMVAAGACFGWTTWMAFRVEALGQDDMIVVFLLLSLPTLGLTVPLLWCLIHRLRQPRRSAWVAAGFLGFAIGVQCWGAARVADDPASIFIANSVLIAVAVTGWLIGISLPAKKPAPPEIP